MFKVLVSLLFLLSQFAFSRPLTLRQKTSDLDELIGKIRAGYGPLLYKEAMGINVDTLRSDYIEEIKNTKTNWEFYYLMVRFVAEFQDSHFRASIPTDLETSLGFTTDLIEGKVLIDAINRDVLPESKFPFSKGDEVVSLGGKLSEDVLEELIPYMGQGFELSARRRAAFMFAKRSASKVPPQSGDVEVEIRQGNSSLTQKVLLTWKSRGKFLDEGGKPKLAPVMNAGVDYDSLSVEESFRCSGTSRIKMPANATVVTKDLFDSYYYPTPKGNVGYLRLPHYNFPDNARAFKQYEFAVRALEKNTVGLIIDQDHNCGGSVEFLHQILSLFMDRPFVPMQFELLATKASYLSFSSRAVGANEYSIDTEEVTKVVDLIKETWLNTEDFLTMKTSISGEEFRYPHHIRYTKPVIVLMDELSGSGGDAFPSMMGGYGRAKLLGTRTMGAGGHVEAITPLTNSQIKVDMTKSLFYRPDGVAVENNGAVPDIAYTTTVNDFKYGHQEYQKFFTDELLKLIP